METAVAKPNPGYIHHNCIKDIAFLAVKYEKRTTFLQRDDHGDRRVTREYLKQFFRTDCVKKKRPFLKKGNEKFYKLLKK